MAYGDTGLDETVSAMREEMRKFAIDKVLPHAHDWHLENNYIPLDVIAEMSAMGVFGLTMTYSGHPAACAVAREAIRIYEEEGIRFAVSQVEELGFALVVVAGVAQPVHQAHADGADGVAGHQLRVAGPLARGRCGAAPLGQRTAGKLGAGPCSGCSAVCRAAHP